MTVKVEPLHTCDKPKCEGKAEFAVTADAHRGRMKVVQVCSIHVHWGRARGRDWEKEL